METQTILVGRKHMNIFARACVCVGGIIYFLGTREHVYILRGVVKPVWKRSHQKEVSEIDQTAHGLRFLFSQVGLWRN